MDSRDLPMTHEALKARIGQLRSISSTRSAVPASTTTDAPLLSWKVLVRGVTRHWWQILLLWLVGTGVLGGVVYVKLKPTYETSSLLRVEATSQDPFSVASSNKNDTFMETQVQLITSTNVLLAAAADPKVVGTRTVQEAVDPVRALREKLHVNIVPRSNLIRIILSAGSSDEAATIVNAVVAAFLKADAEWSESLNRQQIDRLTHYREGLESQVEERKAQLLALADEGDLPQAPNPNPSKESEAEPSSGINGDRRKVSLEEYGRLRAQLASTEIDLLRAQAELDAQRASYQQRTLSSPHSRNQPAFDPSSDPKIAQVLEQIETVRQKLRAAHHVISNPQNDPASIHYKNEEKRLVNLYHELVAQRQAEVENAPHSVSGLDNQRLAQISETTTRINALRATQSQLQVMLRNIDVDVRDHASGAVKASFVKTDLDHLQNLLSVVDRHLHSLNFEARGQSHILLIDEARPSNQVVADKRPKLLMAIPVALLTGLLGLFGLIEIRAGRVTCPDDLSRRVRTEVFAVPPLPGTGPRTRLARRRDQEDPNAPFEQLANQIDHLRVALLEEEESVGHGRCLMVTSADVAEGKTTLVAQLAARCADAGMRTLLIDADLRRASLGEFFEIFDARGLSDVLRGRAHLDDVLIALAPMPGAWLLPAGDLVESPGRILQGARFGQLIEQLRSQFDIILIDTPPILPVPDALILGRSVDVAVLASLHDESRLAALKRAQQQLERARIPLLGIVINGVQPTTTSRYGRYGRYGGSYRATRSPENIEPA